MSDQEKQPLEDPGRDPSAPGDLAPELKSIEARLASLSPRDDRLDHQRLMFLAGRASMAQGGSRRFLWPVSTATMTAVAASLLVLLITRPVRQVVVYKTVEAATAVGEKTTDANDRRPAEADTPATSRDANGPDRTPYDAGAPARPRVDPAALAYLNPIVLEQSAPYWRQRARMLAYGPDVRPDYVTSPVRREQEPAAALSRDELLDSLLTTSASGKPTS